MNVVFQFWGIGSAAGLVLLLCFWQAMTTRRLKCDIAELRQQLADSKIDRVLPKANFSDSLTQVERQFGTPQETSGNSTEKYRYVASLADQGVDAKGIAAALQMAPAEVAQLMQLARLKKQVQEGEH